MSVALDLLFLPAAGLRAEIVRFDWGSRYGVSEAASLTQGRVMYFNGGSSPFIMGVARSSASAIRLASRSELFGCSFDGFGLLFLPAAVLFSSISSAGSDVVYGLRNYRLWFDGVKGLTATSAVSRIFRMHIRLASRQVCPVCGLSVMFRRSKYSEECVVLGCSVPARCGPNE